jgi:hypothetical protein
MSESVLIPKDQWILMNGCHSVREGTDYEAAFNKLWEDHEEQMERMLVLADSAMNRPVVMKEFTPEERTQLDTAIELLTECSNELFVNESNAVLEQQVDEFLSENAECCGACEGCNKDLPSSLKHQAD